MSSSDITYLDDLVARRTDVDCGSCRIVTIPDFDYLSKSEQTAIFAKLEQLDHATSVNASELYARLSLLISTPNFNISLPDSPPSSLTTTEPCDAEEEKERSRLQEIEAGQSLERDGCPPCCSADPALFTPDPADDERREIMSYWEHYPLDSGILHNQWRDWTKFRNFQKRVRRDYLHRRPFTDFVSVVNERRQRHHLEGNACLHLDPKQQSRIETWVEFQNYHLHIHENLEKKVLVEEEGMETTRKKLDDPDQSEAAWATRNFETYKLRVASAKSRAREHGEILLPWIEQHRIALLDEISTNTGSSGNEGSILAGATLSSHSPNPRKRKTDRRCVLDPVQSGVSKRTPQGRILRPRKLGSSQQAKKTIAKPAFPSCLVPQAPQMPLSPHKLTSPPNMSRATKEYTRPDPFRPSKVAKAVNEGGKIKQHTNKKGTPRIVNGSGSSKSYKPVEEVKSLNRKLPPQTQKSCLKTKTGRACRKPERYGFPLNR